MSHGQVSILFIRKTNLQSMNQEKRAMEWLTHGLYDYHRYKGSSSMEPPIFSAQCTTNDYSYKIVFIAICCTESEKTVITLILKAKLTIVGTRISVARHW